MVQQRYIHTYIYTYLPTYLPTYIHTCIHTTLNKQKRHRRRKYFGKKSLFLRKSISKKNSLSEKEYLTQFGQKKNSQLLDAVERQLLALEVQGLLIEFEEVDSFLQVLALKEGPASRADL